MSAVEPAAPGSPAPLARRRFALTLRARLAALVCALFCALVIPLLLLIPARMEALSRRWVESRSLAVARMTASSVEAALDFEDHVAADRVLGGLAGTEGARWAVVVRPDGSLFARWNAVPAQARVAPADAPQVTFDADLLTVQVPIARRATRGGALLLAFDLHELRQRLDETRNWLLVLSAGVLLAGLVAALLIGTVVARPLARMTRVAEQITGGDEGARGLLPIDRGDETGTLARAFDRMLHRLYAQRSALAVTNQTLAEKLADLARAQEQLVAADRRISVGRLAAGVAHEVNNPLAYVSANLRYVRRAVPQLRAALAASPPPPGTPLPDLTELADAVAQAAQGTDRIARIVKGLKSFARDDEGRRTRLQVAEPLEAAIAMAAHEVKHRAQIVRELWPVPDVMANEVRLSQVFLNLIINAGQAIPESEDDEHAITIVTRTSASGEVVVEVKDTGSGIAPDVLPRLFTPFFTTKPSGTGTGLGLSISQGIVKDLGGRIEVESALGQGSTFRVVLPAAVGAGDAPRAEEDPAPAISGATLLVVDDEPLIGQSLCRSLGDAFRVQAVTSGAEALELLATRHFDHVLCDMMMPGMNGAAFHAELARRDPRAAAGLIFMTGGTFTPEARAFVEAWAGPILAKPVELRQLLEAMARASATRAPADDRAA